MDTSVMPNGHLPPRIVETLDFACAAAGMDPSGARLMRMHSNTVFYLPGSRAVARIAAAGPDTAERVSASLAAT